MPSLIAVGSFIFFRISEKEKELTPVIATLASFPYFSAIFSNISFEAQFGFPFIFF
jgi:hypothetical protein